MIYDIGAGFYGRYMIHILIHGFVWKSRSPFHSLSYIIICDHHVLIKHKPPGHLSQFQGSRSSLFRGNHMWFDVLGDSKKSIDVHRINKMTNTVCDHIGLTPAIFRNNSTCWPLHGFRSWPPPFYGPKKMCKCPTKPWFLGGAEYYGEGIRSLPHFRKLIINLH
jgi:hypothetical protein